MKLQELTEEHRWTPQSLSVWLAKKHDDGYGENKALLSKITIENGEVTIDADVHLNLKGSDLPFKFSPTHVHDLTLYSPKSLKGCPKTVRSFSIISKNEVSLEGAPEDVIYKLLLDTPSLKDVHKHIKRFHGDGLRLTPMIQKNVLGVLLIEGVEDIWLGGSEFTNGPGIRSDKGDKMSAVVEILKKHIGKGKAGVLAAQQEMMDYEDDDYDYDFNLEEFASF